MNLGAFAVLSVLSAESDQGLSLQDLSGVARKQPWLAFAMAVFMFSMAGLPPTAGFIGKYLLFYSAIQSGEILLVVIGVLCSAISLYYYLRVLVYMYMREPQSTHMAHRVSIWSTVAVGSMVLLTFQIGMLPSQIVEAAKRAVIGL
jgi:NADH-quinone oxidoreductase subunit N